MDDRDRLLQHLYDERPMSDRLAGRLACEPDLRREYEQMQAAKAALDARPPEAPDPEAVDRILQAARPARRERTSRAADRSRVRHRRPVSRRFGTGIAVAVLAALVWSWSGSTDLPPVSAAGPPPVAAASPIAASEAVSLSRPADRPPPAGPPAWSGDGVPRVHRQMTLVRVRTTTAHWDRSLTISPSPDPPSR